MGLGGTRERPVNIHKVVPRNIGFFKGLSDALRVLGESLPIKGLKRLLALVETLTCILSANHIAGHLLMVVKAGGL